MTVLSFEQQEQERERAREQGRYETLLTTTAEKVAKIERMLEELRDNQAARISQLEQDAAITKTEVSTIKRLVYGAMSIGAGGLGAGGYAAISHW